jgi:hypothetical protein
MNSWKLQKFFGDLVSDLRNRGLLPVVVLLLVAIVAIPIVISRGGSSSAAISDSEQAVANAPEAQSAVLAYQPGLRKYQDRLDKLSAKDPFEQQFVPAGPSAADVSGAGGGAAGGGSPAGASSPTDVSSFPGTIGSGGGSSKKGKKRKSTTRYFSYQADALVGDASAALAPYSNLAPFSPLPSAEVPVLIYLGPNTTGQYGLFLVSSNVSQQSGPGICVPAPDDCALLALTPGQTEDLVYQGDGKTYRIQLVSLRRVVSSKPPN